MANVLLTPDMITKEALALFLNASPFLQKINRQYDSLYAVDGAKIGDTLRIRKPNDYIVRSGPTAVPQDTKEEFTTLSITSQKGVDVAFSTAQRSMSLDDYSSRILRPMMNNLAADIAADVISVITTAPNIVRNRDSGTGATLTPTAATWLQAQAVLTLNSAPQGDRMVLLDPVSEARTVNNLSGFFNSQSEIGRQYMEGDMRRALGFQWMSDVNVPVHITGNYGTPPTVAGANQTGSTLVVSATAGPLKKGDIITIAGVNAVNRVSKNDTGQLRTFAITADVASGATVLPIYPALIAPVGGAKVARQTVTASPANGAVITVATPAAEAYRNNIAFVPDAFTLATADLELPRGVHEASRQSYNGVSMRLVTDYNSTTDQMLTRLDVLYGFGALRPEWAVVVPDAT